MVRPAHRISLSTGGQTLRRPRRHLRGQVRLAAGSLPVANYMFRSLFNLAGQALMTLPAPAKGASVGIQIGDTSSVTRRRFEVARADRS